MKSRGMKKHKDKPARKTGFDAVKSMREIRDQLSREIMDMSFEEEKAYLKKLLSRKRVHAD